MVCLDRRMEVSNGSRYSLIFFAKLTRKEIKMITFNYVLGIAIIASGIVCIFVGHVEAGLTIIAVGASMIGLHHGVIKISNNNGLR